MVRYIAENDGEAPTIHEAPASAQLALLVKGRASQTFPLRGEVQLGREKDNAIVVADQKVSRHHALLSPLDETYIIQDQGSANGTYVNGVRIAQPTRLHHEDKIRLGDAIFLFVLGSTMPETFDRPQAAAASPVQAVLDASIPSMVKDSQPIWLIIGCMAAAIVALLLILAIMFGLFLGRSQFLGLMLWGLVGGV